jgi:hypothetical protein
MIGLGLEGRDVARLLSLGRIAIGGLLFVAPRWAARAWTGESDGTAISAMAVRGLGARDLAIGVGTLFALEEGGHPSSWLQAGAAADATDALSVMVNLGRLPALRGTLLLASSAAAAYLGWVAAAELD